MIVEARAVASVSLAVGAARVVRWIGGGALDAAAMMAIGESQLQLIRAGMAGITKQVTIRGLAPTYGPDRVVVPMEWVATGAAGGMFPILEANLGLYAIGDELTELVLTGSYRPPFGPAGAVLDHVLLHRVAQRTLDRFVGQVAELAARALDRDLAPEDSEAAPRRARSA